MAKSVRQEFSLRAYWFVRGEVRADERPIRSLAAWRRAVEPYRRRKDVALCLDRDGFEAGGVWAHFNGPRAWVTHFDRPGCTASEAHSTAGLKGLPQFIPFWLDNGQVDDVERERTVPRADAMRALEHFLLHGAMHPELRWVA